MQAVTVLVCWRTLERPVSVGGLDPGGADLGLSVLALAGLLLARELVRPRARGRWVVRGRRVGRALRAAGPARRVAMLACAGLVLAAVDGALSLPHRAQQTRRSAALAEVSGLHHSASNDHVPALLDLLARRPDADPVVVLPDSRDNRAHEAAYYAYPRLLLMEPGFRRWSLAARQLRCETVDVGFPDPGPRPGVEASLAFARTRGLTLLEADGMQARLHAPGARAPAGSALHEAHP